MYNKIWKFFASLRLTLILFVLLTLSILIGSFIIQKPFAAEGQIETVYSKEAIVVFEFFGLFDLYHSSWFSFLLFMFGVNNICASVEMWPRHKKLYSHDDSRLSSEAILQLPHHSVINIENNQSESILKRLEVQLTQIFRKPQNTLHNGEQRFYVNKNPWAHFGVYIVHLGVIAILLGGVWGSVDGFEGQMMLAEGQSSNQVKVRNRVEGKGFRYLDFSVLCHAIWIETYENGSPKDYFSDLEIIGKSGESLARGVIQVNHPLSYGGISFYQATYGSQQKNKTTTYKLEYKNKKTQEIISLNLSADETEFNLPEIDTKLKFVTYSDNLRVPFETGIQEYGEMVGFEMYEGHNTQPQSLILFKNVPQADLTFRTDAKGHFTFLGRHEEFELEEVTGIQVARDPGAVIVFIGSAILMIGVWITFGVSHQKIWVVYNAQKGQLVVGGKSHRNPWAFSKKFKTLLSVLENSHSTKH